MSRPPQTLLLSANPLANYLAHREEIDSAVRRVLESGWYILGEEVAAFEREFAAYLGVSDVIGVGSGTEAIHLALRSCGIVAGDEVITVSHTAVATVAAIELAGAVPVLVDIDPSTFTMSPKRLAETISVRCPGKLKAIVVVHLYGHPAEMPAILDIARRHRLLVVEDCAQSHGASLGGRKTGAFGDVAAFSFYPTKNLAALGDGGAVATSNIEIAGRARLLREYGWRDRYISQLSGMNTRLDEMQAAILRVKLRYLDAENARRQQIASAYDAALSPTRLLLPQAKPTANHVYHQYTVRSDRRNELQAALHGAGIGTSILYPKPAHLQPAYQGRLETGVGGLEQSERICREILCLPMHPQLGAKEVACVSQAIIAGAR
jgi:dTDP-4-amino-4,6-dideoxygalactose transaminase